MKIKQFAIALAAMLLAGTALYAQTSKLPRRDEIVKVEIDDNSIPPEYVEVFDAPSEGEHHYFLSVGHLGFGDEVIQINIDPVFELFIPLGDTVSEALETMKSMQALFKEEPGASIELPGCLAFGFPDQKPETVKVTYRKGLLTKMLEFSIEREDYIRTTHIQKSDFGLAVRGISFYQKLHPKQK